MASTLILACDVGIPGALGMIPPMSKCLGGEVGARSGLVQGKGLFDIRRIDVALRTANLLPVKTLESFYFILNLRWTAPLTGRLRCSALCDEANSSSSSTGSRRP